MDKHEVRPENAAQIWSWLQTRGGIAVWKSINLSNPAGGWTTPADASKPTWQCANEPRIITDPAEVVVLKGKEVKRFRIALRMGSQGLNLKLTDGSTNKVHKACEKAGDDSWYEFDYSSQEAVIFVPDTVQPITDWIKENTNDN